MDPNDTATSETRPRSIRVEPTRFRRAGGAVVRDLRRAGLPVIGQDDTRRSVARRLV